MNGWFSTYTYLPTRLQVPGQALRRSRYTLRVRVSDSGRPPLTSSALLTVHVTSLMTSPPVGVAGLMTSRVGGVSVWLVVVVVAVAVVASLVAAIIAVLASNRCVLFGDSSTRPSDNFKQLNDLCAKITSI